MQLPSTKVYKLSLLLLVTLLPHGISSSASTSAVPTEGLDYPTKKRILQTPTNEANLNVESIELTSDAEFLSLTSRSNIPASVNEIETTFVGGSGQCGNMFDIVVLQEKLTIVDFDVHLLDDVEQIEVFIKDGSYAGFEQQSSAWNSICAGSIQGQGFEQRSPLPDSCLSPQTLSSGTYAFYITVNRSRMAYTFDTSIPSGQVYVQNAHMELYMGVGVSYAFGTIFNPRLWNGAIRYTISDSNGLVMNPTKSPTTQPVVLVPENESWQGNTGDGTSLTTTYTSSSGQSGNMFDIIALKSLTVHSLDIHAVDNEQTVELYTKDGTHVNHEQDANAWTKLGTVILMGQGVGVPTSIPSDSFPDVQIHAGRSMAWYVTLVQPEIRYSSGSDTLGAVYAYNTDLLILEGVGNVYPFGPTFSNRVWNGTVRYTRQDTKLVSTYAGGSGQAGVMFDIVANKHVIIESLDLHIASTDTERLQIYTKEGTYMGYETDPDAWHLITDLTFEGKGENNITPVPYNAFLPISVPMHATRALYVTLTDTKLMYTGGTSPGQVFTQNTDLAILEGSGNTYLFGAYFAPRVFNGAIHYSTPYAREISTMYTGGSGQSGIMFDVVPRRDLSVHNMDLHLESESPDGEKVGIEIWTRQGTHVGYEHDAAHWKQITYVEVQIVPEQKRTSLPANAFDPIDLYTNQRQAFYITANVPVLRYSFADDNTSYLGEETFANADMIIYDGSGVEYPFGSSFAPRKWNGSMYYRVSTLNAQVTNRELVTTFLGGSGQAGIMFDIVSKHSDVSVYDFDLHLVSSNVEHVKIFIKDGSHKGYENDPASWRMIGAANILPQHRRSAIPPSTFDPFTIEKGESMGVYLTVVNSVMRYSGGVNGINDVFVENDDIAILEGTGKTYPFGESYAPRVFNGAVRYTVL